MNLLELRGLKVDFESGGEWVSILRDVSFHLDAGEIVGLIGESGSGKSVTSLAVMDLLPKNGRLAAGEILKDPKLRAAMIFQDPMTSLNPSFTVEKQLAETLKHRQGLSGAPLRDRALELLGQVGIPDPRSRLKAFPHQLSGGMAQRVMIAMAMACDPQLLIADEPTTALDVTIQAQILSLIRRMQKERRMGVLLISHDMGVIAQNSSRMCVMYSGEIVEQGVTREILKKPRHPYTEALLACLPSLQKGDRLFSIAGQVPNPARRPSGCVFNPRCPIVQPHCLEKHPDLVGAAHAVRCWERAHA